MTPATTYQPSPARSQGRLSLLRAAACYAEFAILAETWTTSGIEMSLDSKGAGNRLREMDNSGTGKYARYLKGVIPNERTIKTITRKYPASRLRVWAIHPIGLLLTDMTLGADSVRELLALLPHGPARKLIWDESQQQGRTGSPPEIPDQTELIKELTQLRTADAFLALLGRYRLRQILGQTDYEDVYEFALVDCFAEVVGADPHLCLAKHTMLTVFADYIDWYCGWSSDTPRYPIERSKLWSEVSHQIDMVQMRVHGPSVPPAHYIAGYAAQLSDLG